jgi:hypothetical protein
MVGFGWNVKRLWVFFSLEHAGELRINILRRKRGVITPGDTVRGLYHALT